MDGDTVHRCCPEAGETSTSDRCLAVTGGGVGSATGGGGGGGGVSGVDDPVTFGEACNWDSDCVSPLVCVAGGTCNYECQRDRDCDDGEICLEKSCVAE